MSVTIDTAPLALPSAPDPDMTPRLFRALSLASAGVLLVVVVPSNALIGLPELLNGILLGFGMLSLGCFVLARRGVFLYRTFFVILLATLDLAWFVTAGGQGSVNMWLYTGAVSAVVFFRGRRLVIAFGAFLANGCGLYFVEYRWPHLVIPYPDEWVRLLDLVSGLVFSSGTCAVVVWVVLDSYRRERRHLSETVAELERKGAEVHALRGMLPVCAWCKKVRTDTGLWTQVERYLATLPDVQLTHALCPDCQTQHFPDVPTEP